MRITFFACVCALLAAPALAQQSNPSAAPPRIQLSESEMAPRLIAHTAPEYSSTARAARIEGSVVLRAVIATDGSILQLQMVSGNPMLIQDAIRSVSKWRYQPVNRDGEAVEVITTITVTFKMEAGAEPSGDKSAKAPEETSRPETIHLKNGRIIYADTTTDDGAKIEYSIGESIFEIPKSLIQSIDHGSGTATRASSSTSWPNQKSPSAVVTGTPLNKIPVAFGEDTKNWYLDESTEQLREECRSGEFYDRFHPEMQSASSFPNKEDSDRICAVISMDMGYRYENLINRGLELERSLCFAKDGMFSNLPAADPKIRNEQEELKRVSAEFLQRMTDFQKNPSARGGGSRLLLDYYRLGSRCGHGMGF